MHCLRNASSVHCVAAHSLPALFNAETTPYPAEDTSMHAVGWGSTDPDNSQPAYSLQVSAWSEGHRSLGGRQHGGYDATLCFCAVDKPAASEDHSQCTKLPCAALAASRLQQTHAVVLGMSIPTPDVELLLQDLELPAVSLSKCRQQWSYAGAAPSLLGTGHLCAGARGWCGCGLLCYASCT